MFVNILFTIDKIFNLNFGRLRGSRHNGLKRAGGLGEARSCANLASHLSSLSKNGLLI